jgi:NAD(P)-dependent dehydrogenase (short-subunit alcohol dehydrogenase family)
VRFDGRVALVTGGATGIGRATALAIAREGAKVMVTDVNPEDGDGTARLIRDGGGDALFAPADVSRRTDWEGVVADSVRRYGRLDVLFNNAGIGGDLASTADYAEDAFDRVLAINLKGVWLGMRTVIPQMLGQGKGAIVNNASILGLVGFPNAPAYVAAKHAVVGLTKVAALEYAARGIRINAVCPGFIRTPMVEKGLSAEALEQVAQLHALGRLGDSEEVARLVLILASDEASFLTGGAYLVDGGYTARWDGRPGLAAVVASRSETTTDAGSTSLRWSRTRSCSTGAADPGGRGR